MRNSRADYVEWRSHKRWMYLNFGGLIVLLVTVVIVILNGNIPT